MLLLADGILANKFLSPVETRKWMKPEANTASWGYQVGGPWEILRGDNITYDERLIDVYSKSGDLGLYHSQTVMIPDYDIVISIMTGGREATKDPYVTAQILTAVIKTLVPAIEIVGKLDAQDAYGDTYEDKETNSSITFTQDSGPGFKIKSWQMRGFDVLNHIGSYNFNALESGASTKTAYVDARVYPSNLESKGQMAWRAVFDKTPPANNTESEKEIFFKDGTCQTWFQQDRMVYNYLPLDLFVFMDGEDGGKTVKSPAFNITLTKVREPAEKKSAEGQTSGVAERERFGVVGLSVVLAVFMILG
jgi:hypothetical protein